MIYLDLFLGFLKVGCFAFGGAYGAIPLIPMDSEDFFFIFGLSCTCSLLLISAAQIIACPYLI